MSFRVCTLTLTLQYLNTFSITERHFENFAGMITFRINCQNYRVKMTWMSDFKVINVTFRRVRVTNELAFDMYNYFCTKWKRIRLTILKANGVSKWKKRGQQRKEENGNNTRLPYWNNLMEIWEQIDFIWILAHEIRIFISKLVSLITKIRLYKHLKSSLGLLFCILSTAA